MKTNRLYSLFTIKSVQEDQRTIEGIASTPTPDRMNDIVELDGIAFSLPMPFLYQHNADQPIGHVIAAKKTSDGLVIKAQMAADIGIAYINEAWALIKAGLVQGLSIGFRSVEEAYNRDTGGYHFIKTDLYEISAATIPANAEATILNVKSAARAASGQKRIGSISTTPSIRPGVSGLSSEKNMKTIKNRLPVPKPRCSRTIRASTQSSPRRLKSPERPSRMRMTKSNCSAANQNDWAITLCC
jgi:HK97 family phage prohead protease